MSVLGNSQIYDRIKIFISSSLDDKYKTIRNKLRNMLEEFEPELFSVYMFEDSGPSTFTPRQDYLLSLDDSDICIFLIDNKDGIKEGVLEEYQRAKAKEINSLFVFCDQDSKKKTAIQVEIEEKRGPFYYVTNRFEDMPLKAFEGLIKDIEKVYKYYCNRSLVLAEFYEMPVDIQTVELSGYETFSKEIFRNSDKTRYEITKIIYSRLTSEIKNTNSFDLCCSEFLSVLFGEKTIREYNISLLLEELSSILSDEFFDVIKERWNAIQYFWFGNLDKAIEYERKALKLAEERNLSEWLIQDILIDLRNLVGSKEEEKSNYLETRELQGELDKRESTLFYPLIDRYNTSLYQELFDEDVKASTKSPYSTRYGHMIYSFAGTISNIYILSLLNGSFTHLMLIHNRIRDVAFHLCKEYSDWEFRVLFIKSSLYLLDDKGVKKAISRFNDVYGKMNSNDAEMIHEYVNNHPISYKKDIALILSFKYLGYHFSDAYYDEVRQQVFKVIDEWFCDDKKNTMFGDYLFDSIRENILRIDNNIIFTKLIEPTFYLGLKRYYDDAFSVMSIMKIANLSEENLNKQRDLLIEYMEGEGPANSFKFESAVISYKKQAAGDIAFDEIIESNMPKSFIGRYYLECGKRTQLESEKCIYKYLEDINYRNEIQGKDGGYIGFGDNPYLMIKYIIETDGVELDLKIVDGILNICKDTLFSERQLLSSKKDAIRLISFTRLSSDQKCYDFDGFIVELRKDKKIIFSGRDDFFFKTSESTIEFEFTMMEILFGNINLNKLLNMLSSHSGMPDLEKIEALKTIAYLFTYGELTSVNKNVALLLLQFAMNLSYEENHEIRFYAVKSLLKMINKENKEVIQRRLTEIMDYDSYYIKKLILDHSDKLKVIDKEVYDFMLEKAKVDNHYYIRKIALEL